MEIFAFFSILLSLSFAMKERPLNLDQILSDRKLWLQLEKRLGIDEDERPRVNPGHAGSDDIETGDVPELPVLKDSVGDKCLYKKQNRTLIKTNQSLKDGAIFLRSFIGLSREDCVSKCCYTQGCTLAVYENKDDNNCYLFNCRSPNRCAFASHASYVTYAFPGDIPLHPLPPHVKHENELQDLESHGSQVTNTPVPNKRPTTTTTPEPRKPVKQPVVLYHRCNWGDVCEDPYAECRSQRCECSTGYHAKYGVCRQVCSSEQFECDNRRQDRNVLDCIGNSYVCDGSPQCADGSDEFACPQNGSVYNPPPPKTAHTEDSKQPEQPVNNDVSKQDSIEEQQPGGISPEDNDHDQDTVKETDSGVVESHETPPEESDKSSAESNEEVPDSLPTTAEAPVIKEGKEETDADKPVTNNTSLNNAGLKENSEKGENSFGVNEEERFVVASFTDSSQGPIVALSLGLAITLMLLVFVGCRLRTVKRRIRKGRVLHSNEADYLINGMYL